MDHSHMDHGHMDHGGMDHSMPGMGGDHKCNMNVRRALRLAPSSLG